MDETRRIRGEHRHDLVNAAWQRPRAECGQSKVNLPCVEPVERQGGGERRLLRGASMRCHKMMTGAVAASLAGGTASARRSRSSRSESSSHHRGDRAHLDERSWHAECCDPRHGHQRWCSPARQPRPDGLVRGVEVGVLGHEHRPLHDIAKDAPAASSAVLALSIARADCSATSSDTILPSASTPF